ncbi:hypothetical protein AOQ84DRAFT_225070 [Glonium stellatum]|uniref:Uncharacterized protein n=1 Tax=Glonium stellatum TaxID=574774 RepID=A0A8E2JPY5_9PEZI|nr:hypothetical protein AOQ84DRAFT_225070 [Glonium stellatum]
MYLKSSISLDENTAGLTPEQLDELLESVHQQKKKLEDDIAQYILQKQNDLRAFEQTLLAHLTAASNPMAGAQNHSVINETVKAPEQLNMETNHETQISSHSSDESLKIRNDTLVRERDLELCGLITPSFLPLLDASSSRGPKKSQIPQLKRKDAAEVKELKFEKEKPKSTNVGLLSSSITTKGIGGENTKKENDEKNLKTKRTSTKKSSLRRGSNPKPVRHRKRVSLVINDQIVHPSDSVRENTIAVPSSEIPATTSNSIEELQEAIKKMMGVGKPRVSIDSDDMLTDQSASNTSDEPASPQAIINEFLNEEPGYMSPEDREAIYAHDSVAPSSSYVGGYYGSGVDNLDQRSSYGYPSSQGASFMEEYMAKRPFSVRKAAADAEAEAIREANEAKKALEDEFVKTLKAVCKDDVTDGTLLGEMEDI